MRIQKHHARIRKSIRAVRIQHDDENWRRVCVNEIKHQLRLAHVPITELSLDL